MPPHASADKSAMEETIAQAIEPAVRQARWGKVRGFRIKTSAGKSRQSAVPLKMRLGGVKAAIVVTVLIVATTLCAEAESVALAGATEQVA